MMNHMSMYVCDRWNICWITVPKKTPHWFLPISLIEGLHLKRGFSALSVGVWRVSTCREVVSGELFKQRIVLVPFELRNLWVHFCLFLRKFFLFFSATVPEAIFFCSSVNKSALFTTIHVCRVFTPSPPILCGHTHYSLHSELLGYKQFQGFLAGKSPSKVNLMQN